MLDLKTVPPRPAVTSIEGREDRVTIHSSLASQPTLRLPVAQERRTLLPDGGVLVTLNWMNAL